MPAPLPEAAAIPDRDRRRPLLHAFVWLPTGLWTGALLVGLRAAVELAFRHRFVGTASADEAALLLWETLRGLPALAWSAALAGPVAAALAFRFGRERPARVVVTLLGAGIAAAALAAQAGPRGRPGWRVELALDAPLVVAAAVLVLVAGTVRVVDVGARLVGPLEDAPAFLRPLLGGGATAGGGLALALALALPPIVATPPERVVVLPVLDLVLEPEAIRAAGGTTAAVSAPLTPRAGAYRPPETRRALRWTPPATLDFDVAPNASHLLADFAVDADTRFGRTPTLSLRCDVLLDGVVATREEVRNAPDGELEPDGRGPRSWRRLGGPDGVPIAGVEEVTLRLELVGPRDPEVVGATQGWVGFAPLAQVERRSVRFAAPTRARPSLFVVRLPRDVEPPARAWEISLEGGGLEPELPALATELLRAGAATAASGPRPAGRTQGFETTLASPAALDRWLETRAAVRSFLWLDLADPAFATGAGGARELLDRLEFGPVADVPAVWVFLDEEGSAARVGDLRHATALDEAVLSPRELREALAARTRGAAPSVAVAWQRAADTEDAEERGR